MYQHLQHKYSFITSTMKYVLIVYLFGMVKVWEVWLKTKQKWQIIWNGATIVIINCAKFPFYTRSCRFAYCTESELPVWIIKNFYWVRSNEQSTDSMIMKVENVFFHLWKENFQTKALNIPSDQTTVLCKHVQKSLHQPDCQRWSSPLPPASLPLCMQLPLSKRGLLSSWQACWLDNFRQRTCAARFLMAVSSSSRHYSSVLFQLVRVR